MVTNIREAFGWWEQIELPTRLVVHFESRHEYTVVLGQSREDNELQRVIVLADLIQALAEGERVVYRLPSPNADPMQVIQIEQSVRHFCRAQFDMVTEVLDEQTELRFVRS